AARRRPRSSSPTRRATPYVPERSPPAQAGVSAEPDPDSAPSKKPPPIKQTQEKTMKSLTRKILALSVATAAAISLAGCAVTTGNPAGNGGKDGASEAKDEYRVAYIARAQA